MTRNQRPAAVNSASRTKALANDLTQDSANDEDQGNDVAEERGDTEYVTGKTNHTQTTNQQKNQKPAAKGKAQASESPKRKNRRKELEYDEYYLRIDKQQEAIERWKKKLAKESEKLELTLIEKESGKEEARMKIHELEKRLKKSEALAEEMDGKISDLQAERVDALRSGEDSALPDNVVTAQFNTLFRESKSWSNSWAENEPKSIIDEYVEAVD